MRWKNLNSETRAERKGHEPPHALKSSQYGRMISDFRVQDLESKLTM